VSSSELLRGREPPYDLEDVLDLPDQEIEVAGNGAHEIRGWVAVAGAVAPTPGRALSYESVYPRTKGMVVSLFEPS